MDVKGETETLPGVTATASESALFLLTDKRTDHEHGVKGRLIWIG
jgi:hypothetical protein